MLEFSACKDGELARFLHGAITIKIPDISNKTTDIGAVSTFVYDQMPYIDG